MISFRSVSKAYGSEPVFKNFSETVEDGEFILLTGESGSGKTTLLKLITKEISPDAGDIQVGRYLLSEISADRIPYYRRDIGVVYQDFRLFNDLNVYANLEFVLSITGGRKKDFEKRITSILSMMGIDHLHKRYPKELSGGEQQKVCMARALLNHPMALLADEPTGNLDPESSKEIMHLMELAHRQGITVILATHDYALAESLSLGYRRIELKKQV